PPPSSLFSLFFVDCSGAHVALHSFPTRRSSDLAAPGRGYPSATSRATCWCSIEEPRLDRSGAAGAVAVRAPAAGRRVLQRRGRPDRKSTRLNSSHDQISYAVFCLKKKKTLHTNA